MERNDNMFKFEGEDISSNSEKPEFEDIVSSSSSSKKGGKHYAKKKRGNAFTKWWAELTRLQKGVLIGFVSLLLVFCILVGSVLALFNYNYNAIPTNPEDLGFDAVINKKITNIALFGIDARNPDTFSGLSDSIMILSLNAETKKVKIVSIMRDSLVPISYNGRNYFSKINNAYLTGGPTLAIKTLNTIFGLDISEYATVNFYGMADIIDAVGGIDVTLSEDELNTYGYENGKKVNWGLNGIVLDQCKYMGLDGTKYQIHTPGKHHLNGVQAVAYARIRRAANFQGTNNDFGRTDRQRYVMEQLFNKATKLNKSKYISLAKALMPCSETSLSMSDILNLAGGILLSSPTFEQSRVPLDVYRMDSLNIKGVGSCLYYDLDYAGKIIRAFFYDDIKPEDYIEQNGVEKNDWYTGGNIITGNESNEPTDTSSVSSGTTSSEDTGSDVSSNESSDSSEASSEEESSSEEGESSEEEVSSEVGSDSSSEETSSEVSSTDNTSSNTSETV